MGCSSVTDETSKLVAVSIVSHGQGAMVEALLGDLEAISSVGQVILTQNLPEPDIECPKSLEPRLTIIRNPRPIGFAANHNQAFRECRSPYFAVVNPDVRLIADPFPKLVEAIELPRCGLAAPIVRDPNGALEDSARAFPTPLSLLRKLLRIEDGRHMVLDGDHPVPVDWAAGMFLVFAQEVFGRIRGFDEKFFLYYEDVDICARLGREGLQVMVHPGTAIVHAAQRASRKRPKYMAWHLASMARYFVKHFGRYPNVRTSIKSF